MANISLPFVFKRRPCYVKDKKAFFHVWFQESQIVAPSILSGGHSGGVVATVLGLVEFEDGTISKEYPEQIKFADGGGFDEYCFLNVGDDK